MNKKNDPQAWAEHYLAGFSTFPLKSRRKKPAGSWKRYQSERAGEEQISDWVGENSGYNIGIATGAISGIVVLDLDSAEATRIAEAHGLPKTVEALTPRGRHLYFRHPNYPIGNVTGSADGQLPKGIDVRGDGGYVVGAGSYFVPTADEVADGKVEGAYRWREGHSPIDLAYADMPQWLVDSYKPKAQAQKPQPNPQLQAQNNDVNAEGTPYGLAALDAECDKMRSAEVGTRNGQLNRSAYYIARLVAGRELGSWDAKQALEKAAQEAGLSNSGNPANELKNTLESGWKSGLKKPRSAPDDGLSFPQSSAVIEPESEVVIDDPLKGLMSAADAMASTPVEREWLIEGWLPVGATTTLFGDGRVGKSLITMQIASAVASGKALWGCDATKAPVLAFYCEDSTDELIRRQHQISASMMLPQAELRDCMMQSRFGMPSLLGNIDKRTGAYQANDLFHAVAKEAKRRGARLIILDNINMVFGDDINDAGAVTRFMAMLNSLALEIDGAVLLVGHIAKSEASRFAGTMAWSNASRNRLYFGRPENAAEAARNPDLRRLLREKSNYATVGETLDLMWHKGAMVRPEDLSATSVRTHQEVSDDTRFLSELDRLTTERKALSIKKNARNYAPRLMATDGKMLNRDFERRMIDALARLLKSGAIVEEADLPWTNANRTTATGIARAQEGGEVRKPITAEDILARVRKQAA